MRNITKTTINKALDFEEKLAESKWNKFRELLSESKLNVVITSGSTLYIKIEGEDKADIEIFESSDTNGRFVHIELWYYDFIKPEFTDYHRKRGGNDFKAVGQALNYIYTIIEDIQRDRKMRRNREH